MIIMITAIDIIEKKRDGMTLSRAELEFFVDGYTHGEIPDYQAAAFLMAVYLRGLDMTETVDLTLAMANSGQVIDLSAIKSVKVDKHSTGGVGDKVSFIALPMAAACGICVPKMSGPGLGHTGGTVDKLASIPGYKTEISPDMFLACLEQNNISMVAQTANIAPADKKLYALRNATSTVENISLIASSIMSKKLASGADRIVLDVKVGQGAFLKTPEQARALAKTMCDIGNMAGKPTVCLLTSMEAPLGMAIGNALEVRESIAALKGNCDPELMQVCLKLAGLMLSVGLNIPQAEAEQRCKHALETGKALETLKKMVAFHGGTTDIFNDGYDFNISPVSGDLVARQDGYITINAHTMGKASLLLGAGRLTKESAVDYGAGIVLAKKAGDRVLKGEALARLYTSDDKKLAAALELAATGVEYFDIKPAKTDIILGEIV